MAYVGRLIGEGKSQRRRAVNRPNIVLLSTDQQTWDAIGGLGNQYVSTPNIDRIRAAGVSFSRAYCTNPVCAPARSSWATGRYSSETGVPFNEGLMHDDLTDIGELLSSDGYGTYHSGKWHVAGRDVRRGFDSLYFGKAEIVAGGGEYYDGPTTRAAVDFLTSGRAKAPFYLQIGLINPHDICEFEHLQELNDVPDPIRQGLLSENDLPPLPENFTFDPDETTVQQVFRRNEDALIHRPIQRQARHWSPLQWRYLAWMHSRYVERVDVEIGHILAALDASDLNDNTILIFTSDHGEAAGRHQMFQKFTLYEESVRVPLTVASMGNSGPIAAPGASTDALVSGVDLFATICNYAGVDAPEGTQGRSVRPLVEGRTSSHRDHIFIENNYWERAVVTERFKFITEYVPNPGDETTPPGPETHDFGTSQLFDLSEDPNECENIATKADSADLLERLRAHLVADETRIARRPLRDGLPREAVHAWAEAMRAGWKTRRTDA